LRLGRVFNRSFWVISALAAASGVACYLVSGPADFFDSLWHDAELVALLVPKIGAAMLIASFIQVLLPRDKVAAWLGEKAGFKAIALSTGAGMVTPGGPMTSFPVVSALGEAGTGQRSLVAYLTSWSTLGLQRILMWEVPLMGVEFAALRFVASLPLPFVAAVLSRYVPIDPKPPAAE
jgi:uncharacterized membrane protein YraQ (UPF0718 family)